MRTVDHERPVARADLVDLVAARFGAHPWAALCTAPAIPWSAGRDLGAAVVWRSGHPWRRDPCWHGLGDPEAVATGLADVRGHVVVPAGTPFHGTPWTLRLAGRPAPVRPGEEDVGWLDSPAGVDDLLDRALPHAAVRPGDADAGRFCGVRADDGRLLACAAETLLAAPYGHLSSLAVHPDARGCGLGAAVTAWFTRSAFRAGAPAVVLGVDGGNDAADRLYDRLGFDRWPMLGAEREEER